jgi:hypothetical protein
MKMVFSHNGIPESVVSDMSYEYKQFAKEWDFQIIPSSLTYAQSKGTAECSKDWLNDAP